MMNQGIDRTLSISRLLDVGSKSVVCHCTFCVKCQLSKAPSTNPAPLQPIIATQPWEMVAVDVLKVPISTKGNQYNYSGSTRLLLYLLLFAFPMQDQKVEYEYFEMMSLQSQAHHKSYIWTKAGTLRAT